MKRDYLEKTGDVYRIEERLREIDPTYELYFNKKYNRFEVYSTKNGVWSLAFISPFSEIDNRLITYARKTRAERADELNAEIEEVNRKKETEKMAFEAEEKRRRIEEIKNKLKSKNLTTEK